MDISHGLTRTIRTISISIFIITHISMLYLALRPFFSFSNDIHDHDHAPDMKTPEDKQIKIRKPEAVHALSLSIALHILRVAALKNMVMRHVAHCTFSAILFLVVILATRMGLIAHRRRHGGVKCEFEMALASDKIKRPWKRKHDHKTGNAATG